MSLVLSAIPDELVIRLFEMHAPRCDVRSVTKKWRDIIDRHFEIQHFSPPDGRMFTVDFEIDGYMAKHLYCAQVRETDMCEHNSFSGTVTFVDWVPACFRGRDRQIHHELDEKDACTLWKCISKARNRSKSTSCSSDSSDDDGSPQFGRLAMSEGATEAKGDATPERKRDVIGKLSAKESEEVLQLIDFRRNRAARPLAAALAA